MKMLVPALAFVLLTACTSPSDDTNEPGTANTPTVENAPAPGASPVEPAPGAPTSAASANGTVEAIDVAARTITIAHGPVESLKWPAMTMTFAAPDADLASFKKGDRVAFEFTEHDTKATITRITRQ